MADERTTSDKGQIRSDYTALLRALLPGLRGIRCHGRDRSLLWSEEPHPPIPLNDACHAALDVIREDDAAAPARIDLADAAAYLLPLRNEKAQALGVLVLLVAADQAQLPASDCATALQPATRTLERELSLRVRLVEGYRKLGVQAAEERLLHEVERVVAGSTECEPTLRAILVLCRKLLQLRTAAILIPEKNILVVEGQAMSRVELEAFSRSAVTGPARENQSHCAAVIRGADESPAGILVLAGWQGPEFSGRRRSRVGRFVAAHMATVLDRTYDSLTGLTAWSAFEKQLTLSVAANADGDEPPKTLMYFDIDRLDVANDTLGREIGDRVLASFATVLRDELPGHLIARVGGDRFAALLTEGDLDAGYALGERIAARFRLLEFGQGERSYRAAVSIGIGTIADEDALRSERGPLATAMVACDAAKDRGRGRVEVYEPADVSIIQRFDDIHLVGYIRNAIELGRLALLGQPIFPVKAGTDRPGYYEVLVRLLDSDDSHISPNEFLSAAERYQLMEELDRWVVANTLSMLGRSAVALGVAGTRFAINLSGQSLGSEAFLPFVQEQLARSRVPPSQICFEITETVAMANLQRAQNFMHTLRRTGCRFSIDDFGTGLSSFAYLKLFPVDTLKIDGSFVRDLPTNAVSQSVVAAIAEVARVMELETVAEFVQDQATLDLLGRLGISWAQGYLLGEPQLLAELPVLAADQQVSPVVRPALSSNRGPYAARRGRVRLID